MPDWPDLDRWLPSIGPPPERQPPPPHVLRHPRDADFGGLDRRLRAWAGDRSERSGPWRAWVRDFGSTAWLAEGTDGARPLGLLLGYLSPDRPGEAVLRTVVVDPAMRRRGIGRELVERFASQAGELGAARLAATCRPDDRAALGFLAAAGFAPDEASGVRRFGVPAYPDWDGEGEDRVVLRRPLATA